MGSMVRAFAPFFPGQTVAQEPQPRQSRASTVMEKNIPGMPVMGIFFISAGAAAASSSVMAAGRMVA